MGLDPQERVVVPMEVILITIESNNQTIYFF